ncbi:alpha-1,2-fucosyltransferase [Flavobacterium sp. AS60]|uniref:alpha-1,2-fucosyltransferase n=1 Tax=Flavobacterium anseongense TaxID=2910677 RepID=UPI001F1A97CB|nr:alpha-1,2-fucosyltransferase [Flavobacterium sp. AS60]MCF6129915.1 alpha-1,2-fucosyltransferase [Flavobacterium sp. AS60]
MIVTRIYGGLGNQLFQYAVAKSLAIEKNQKFALDISGFETYKLHNYSLQHFNIQSNFYKKPNRFVAKFLKTFFKCIKYREADFGYNSNVFSLEGDYIFLEGYFQSEKYFLKHQNEIRNDFEIIAPLKEKSKAALAHIESVNSVSIHIRRGDFLNNERHNTDKSSYYKEAIERIESSVENPVFFVFSDDINWSKANLYTKHETNFIDFNDALTNFEDLKLMSSCKHNIIANSSFSWWAAWLNKNESKIVIAPKKWLNDNTNTNDIIPETWIKI